MKAISNSADENVTKVLGVSWDSKADNFVFQFDNEKIDKAVETPCQLVSVQGSIYDPLGFLSPFCLLGRKLLQQAASGTPGWGLKAQAGHQGGIRQMEKISTLPSRRSPLNASAYLTPSSRTPTQTTARMSCIQTTSAR